MTTKEDSFLKRFLREPLVHFLLIGAAIFAASIAMDPGTSSSDQDRIVLTKADQDRIQERFQATWRRSATTDEMEKLIEDAIREEVYVREARALGLDRGDAAVRQRLRQKMAFLMSSAAAAETPEEGVLRAYFEENADAYMRRSRVGFEQVFLGETRDEAAIESALTKLRTGTDPDQVGQRTMMPPGMRLSSREAIDGTFGTGVFDVLADAPEGEWSGPVRSGFGLHLIRVTERQDAELPEFETVRENVLRDWLQGEAQRFEAEAYQRMRDRYEIEIAGEDAG